MKLSERMSGKSLEAEYGEKLRAHKEKLKLHYESLLK